MRGVIYQYKLADKYYVGKTLTAERKRIGKHKFEALTLKKDHPFCRAIRKYGWDMTIAGYSIIEEIFADTKEELNAMLIEREEFWIKERNALVPNGYNIYSNGQVSMPHTYNKEEIYSRVSKSLKGKYMNPESSSRKIFCVEQNKWYPSISEAERQNNIAYSSIGKAAKGINCKAGGLTWSYDGKKHERINGTVAQRKPIICIETNKEYNSIYQAAEDIYGKGNGKAKKPAIQAALKYNRAANGLHFQYLNYVNPVLS